MRLIEGDCLAVLPTLEAESFDSCVCDPPYHLTSIVKRFGAVNAAPAQFGTDGAFSRASRGFMGKVWDGGDVAFRPETWAAVWRVLKPGAYLLAFSGTRTYHRMVCAIEDAGFEVRDQIGWMFGQGFPKSHDVSKGIDKAAGAERSEIVGSKLGRPGMAKDGSNQRNGFDNAFGGAALGIMASDIAAPATPEAAQWSGWGTALKPAWEPIVLARKPLIGTVAANVLLHGTGAINIDGCRVVTTERPLRLRANEYRPENVDFQSGSHAAGVTSAGRWPANVIHDGSDDVLEAFAVSGESKSAARKGYVNDRDAAVYGRFDNSPTGPANTYADTGTAARFFYCAKASKADRAGSKHPTVKPVALMQYLVRLVTPPNGRVLDPFAGSGTTGAAALAEGVYATLIERDPEYATDIRRRLGLGSMAEAVRRNAEARQRLSAASLAYGL